MQACVYSCSPSDSIEQAMGEMQRHQLHRLPVTDQLGMLVGIIALNDLAREAARQHVEHHSELALHDVGETIDFFAELAPSLKVRVEPETFSEMQTAVEALQYEQVLSLLSAAGLRGSAAERC